MAREPHNREDEERQRTINSLIAQGVSLPVAEATADSLRRRRYEVEELRSDAGAVKTLRRLPAKITWPLVVIATLAVLVCTASGFLDSGLTVSGYLLSSTYPYMLWSRAR